MEKQHFAVAVKNKLEEKLGRIVTSKQMEHMWKELSINFEDDIVTFVDKGRSTYTTRDEEGVSVIYYNMYFIYNWYDLLAGLPDIKPLPVKIDLNTMMC